VPGEIEVWCGCIVFKLLQQKFQLSPLWAWHISKRRTLWLPFYLTLTTWVYPQTKLEVKQYFIGTQCYDISFPCFLVRSIDYSASNVCKLFPHFMARGVAIYWDVVRKVNQSHLILLIVQPPNVMVSAQRMRIMCSLQPSWLLKNYSKDKLKNPSSVIFKTHKNSPGGSLTIKDTCMRIPTAKYRPPNAYFIIRAIANKSKEFPPLLRIALSDYSSRPDETAGSR
jgi:hypothetical protein